MSKQKWINLVSVYSIIYTVITLLNSVLYLCNGIYEDPSGNWHELDRAIILLIGVAAFELCTSLPIKPLILRYIVAYIRPSCLPSPMSGLPVCGSHWQKRRTRIFGSTLRVCLSC